MDVSWLFYGMFYGLIGDRFGMALCLVLWMDCRLFCGLNWDCFCDAPKSEAPLITHQPIENLWIIE